MSTKRTSAMAGVGEGDRTGSGSSMGERSAFGAERGGVGLAGERMRAKARGCGGGEPKTSCWIERDTPRGDLAGLFATSCSAFRTARPAAKPRFLRALGETSRDWFSLSSL
jgi:hypothetical protein